MYKKKATGKESFAVLLATDNQRLVDELQNAFEDSKVEFLLRQNARELLLTLAERPIDLLIFDLDIVALKGLETLAAIKQLKPQVRVVILSEDLSFETREALAKQGVILQLQKAMQVDQLKLVVIKVVDKLRGYG